MVERMRVERDCDVCGEADAERWEIVHPTRGRRFVDLGSKPHTVIEAWAAGASAPPQVAEPNQAHAPSQRRTAAEWVRDNTRRPQIDGDIQKEGHPDTESRHPSFVAPG